jgi:hypothetical protein
MEANCEYDYKIDNFKMRNITNAVYSSLVDNDPDDGEVCVGVLHLFNSMSGEITSNDLIRVKNIRKLIGSQIERAKLVDGCLQTVLTMLQNEAVIATLEHKTDLIAKEEDTMVVVHSIIPSFKH